MISIINNSLRHLVRRYFQRRIPIQWIKKDRSSWLFQKFNMVSIRPKTSAYSKEIETLAWKTNKLGAQPLWKGYEGNNVGGSKRMPDKVRTASEMGDLYTFLVQELKPRIVVEFGTAFGVSGMYFLEYQALDLVRPLTDPILFPGY